MTSDDKYLYEILERDFISCVEKIWTCHDIPLKGPHLNGELVTYRGDLPRSSGHVPDKMAFVVDEYRKNSLTSAEEFARVMLYKIPERLRNFILYEMVYRKWVDDSKGFRSLTQLELAHVLQCSIDQYKKARARAKETYVYLAKENGMTKYKRVA